MFGQIFKDITTAAKLTVEIRKARKAGTGVRVQRTYTIPLVDIGCWSWTLEGSMFALSGDLKNAVKAVFLTFDEETQHALTFVPKVPGGWAARARMWQRALKPALPPSQYHTAMTMILSGYIKCVKRRAEAAV